MFRLTRLERPPCPPLTYLQPLAPSIRHPCTIHTMAPTMRCAPHRDTYTWLHTSTAHTAHSIGSPSTVHLPSIPITPPPIQASNLVLPLQPRWSMVTLHTTPSASSMQPSSPPPVISIFNLILAQSTDGDSVTFTVSEALHFHSGIFHKGLPPPSHRRRGRAGFELSMLRWRGFCVLPGLPLHFVRRVYT